MGKSMLHFNRFDSMDEVVARILRFTPAKLRDIANELLDPSALSLLIYK
jgi:hypothetical protein